MKTIPVTSFLAALAASIFAPISLELAGSLLFATGLGCMLAADYARKTATVGMAAEPVANRAPAVRHAPAPHFGLAA